MECLGIRLPKKTRGPRYLDPLTCLCSNVLLSDFPPPHSTAESPRCPVWTSNNLSQAQLGSFGTKNLQKPMGWANQSIPRPCRSECRKTRRGKRAVVRRAERFTSRGQEALRRAGLPLSLHRRGKHRGGHTDPAGSRFAEEPEGDPVSSQVEEPELDYPSSVPL